MSISQYPSEYNVPLIMKILNQNSNKQQTITFTSNQYINYEQPSDIFNLGNKSLAQISVIKDLHFHNQSS